MKLSLFKLILLCMLPLIAEADMQIQILLNGGNMLESEQICDSWDVEVLEAALHAASQNQRRGLQDRNKVMKRKIISFRDLVFYPPGCKKSCRGFATGHCLVTNCAGFRRLGLRDPDTRNLYWSSNCEGQMEELNDALNTIQAYLSLDCQALLDAPRLMSCITDEGCVYESLAPDSDASNDSSNMETAILPSPPEYMAEETHDELNAAVPEESHHGDHHAENDDPQCGA
jgi:hypothetical protein